MYPLGHVSKEEKHKLRATGAKVTIIELLAEQA